MYEEMETLWPYKGFSVRASERRLGEGKLTLTEQSLLFEPKDGLSLGFDLSTLRLIRLVDVHTVELAYSIQGELRSTSLKVLVTFPNGAEREALPAKDDPEDHYRASLFRAITGGVVARFLQDHTNAKVEGLAIMADEKFEEKMKDLERTITLFPDKKQYDSEVWWDEELRTKSLEEAESEPKIWDDPYRERLFYSGTNPSMTVDNAFEKLDLLREDWANGRINPLQRVRCVTKEYKVDKQMSTMGYNDEQGEPPEVWMTTADKLVQFEKLLGINILDFV